MKKRRKLILSPETTVVDDDVGELEFEDKADSENTVEDVSRR
jgi:hypothetical protein